MAELKRIEITKTVPVNDLETLTVYLNRQLEEAVKEGNRDGGSAKKKLGETALKLIQGAGFHLDAPATQREPKDTYDYREGNRG